MSGSEIEPRIRRSKGVWAQVLDLADEQGWRVQPKEKGFLFYAPKAIARPGLERIYVEDPGSESHKQRHLVSNLSKAGLKFPDDDHSKRSERMNAPTKLNIVPAVAPPASPFAAIRHKISATVTLLSEIETELASIETDTAKLRQFKDLLKQTLGE